MIRWTPSPTPTSPISRPSRSPWTPRSTPKRGRRSARPPKPASRAGASCPHIERRYAKLEAVKHDVPEFSSVFRRRARARRCTDFEARGMRSLSRGWASISPRRSRPECRTLIPSDLGAHNALRGSRWKPVLPGFRIFRLGRSHHQHRELCHASRHAALPSARKRSYQHALLRHFRPASRSRSLDGPDAALCPAMVRHHPGRIAAGALAASDREQSATIGSWDEVRREQINKARALISRVRPVAAAVLDGREPAHAVLFDERRLLVGPGDFGDVAGFAHPPIVDPEGVIA